MRDYMLTVCELDLLQTTFRSWAQKADYQSYNENTVIHGRILMKLVTITHNQVYTTEDIFNVISQ